jgi:L-seryl-tRNA(Ser) seleniumtransferase
VALATDLGSGALIDMTRYGLPAEPTPQADAGRRLRCGHLLGDKLLGGPQAGLIVGSKA